MINLPYDFTRALIRLKRLLSIFFIQGDWVYAEAHI